MKELLQTVFLLLVSNMFMTVAWYGHLKDKGKPLVWAILISWGIAFFEYVFQVPANRIGSGRFTLTQLKVMQECITLCVFLVYAFIVFRETPKWNTILAMLLIVGAVYLTFLNVDGKSSTPPPHAAALPAEGHPTQDIPSNTGAHPTN